MEVGVGVLSVLLILNYFCIVLYCQGTYKLKYSVADNWKYL
jgi:hypothetical protein